MRTAIRPGLPQLPERMKALPVNEKGYPVPWFVAKVNGVYDFRIVGDGKILAAVTRKLCWMCGERLGKHVAFVIGPMCVVNRASAEPPSHRECAEFAVKACPFLTMPNAKRRDANMPGDTKELAGEMLMHNPGVALVYITQGYSIRKVHNGIMFHMGACDELLGYREGVQATRQQILDGMETGLKYLRNVARDDNDLVLFEKMVAAAMLLLPKE